MNIRRFCVQFLPWSIVAVLFGSYLFQMQLQPGYTIAPDTNRFGKTISSTLYRKAFTIGDITVWKDVTGHIVIMERDKQMVAMLESPSSSVILTLMRKGKEALTTVLSETNSALRLHVTDDSTGVSWIVYDKAWSGVPSRRLMLQNGTSDNSKVEEFVGGRWELLEPLQ